MSRLNRPSGTIAAVSLSDSVDLVSLPRTIYVSVAGTLKINDEHGNAVTYPVAIAGYHPIRPSRVWLTGTSATGIIALY